MITSIAVIRTLSIKKPMFSCVLILVACLFISVFAGLVAHGETKLRVVATLQDYACLAREIGSDRVEVQAIVGGEQDAHFIRPKPSFVSMISRADLLVATGLDLEIWLQAVLDKSSNSRVRPGSSGYVSASEGVDLVDRPESFSHSEGGVHIYGNPHITCSPLNMRVAARNIAEGLIRVDPQGRDQYAAGLKAFTDALDRRLFGSELVDALGGDTLAALASSGKLLDFLGTRKLGGKPIADLLGGWLKKAMPLRGREIVTYHKNWVYLLNLLGISEAGTVEPKPGIPPSPRHVVELTGMMKARKIPVILAANYFDRQKVDSVANSVGAKAVMVPLYVNGAKEVTHYFDLVDLWIELLLKAITVSMKK